MLIDWISVVLSLVSIGWIVLLIVALRQIFTSRELTDTNRLLWALIVLVAPVVGTIIWFVVGRSRSNSLRR